MIRTKVLVVGAGMAGLAVAAQLLARGETDLLVASAGTWPPGAEGAAPGRIDDRTRARWSSANASYSPVPGLGARIGGRSLCWEGIVLPIEPSALTAWPREVSERLTGAGGLYAATAEHLRRWRGAPLDEPTCPGDTGMRSRLAECGWSMDVVPQAASSELTRAGRVWHSYSPLHDLADPAALPPWLLPDHTALCVKPTGAGLRSSFRTARDPVEVIESACVVLAAGTLENTRLFAQAEAATRPRTRTVLWPDLCAKLKHGMTAAAPDALARMLRPGNRVFLTAAYPDLMAMLFLEMHADRHGAPMIDIWWQAEQALSERGSIRFDAHRPNWPATIRAVLGPIDRELVARRQQLAGKLLGTLGCRLGDEPSGLPRAHGEAAREHTALTGESAHYLNGLGTGQHESGTVALGRNLDSGFMSKRVEGLFVSGPASFPRMGAANPGLTILASARLVAEHVHRHLR